jgi:hypothetical protein
VGKTEYYYDANENSQSITFFQKIKILFKKSIKTDYFVYAAKKER